MQSPRFTLTGKVALVTGAARGIGFGMAEALSSAGCAVALHDLDLSEAQKQADAFNQAGGRAIALGGDICDLSLAPALVDQTRSLLGGIHILINSASIQSHIHWTKLDRERFDRELHANVLFPVMLCQRAEPTFREQRWGRIVNVGSIQQKWGNEDMLSYAASKAALENITLALARDLGQYGVTVNVIAPGYFDTARNQHTLIKPGAREKIGDSIPLKRIGQPQDAAGLTLLLCSDAGAYITGQTIYLDGGMSTR